MHQLSRLKKIHQPLGKQRLDFRPSRDKVVHRETAANVCGSLRTKKQFFCSHFCVEMYEKILKKMKIKVTGPTGNSEDRFLLPRKTHCFPWSQSLVTYFTNFARCLYQNFLDAKVNNISRVARVQKMRKQLEHRRNKYFLAYWLRLSDFWIRARV